MLDKLERERKLSFEEALRVAEKVATALESAHRRGLVDQETEREEIVHSTNGESIADDLDLASESASSEALGAEPPENGGGRVGANESGEPVSPVHFEYVADGAEDQGGLDAGTVPQPIGYSAAANTRSQAFREWLSGTH